MKKLVSFYGEEKYKKETKNNEQKETYANIIGIASTRKAFKKIYQIVCLATEVSEETDYIIFVGAYSTNPLGYLEENKIEQLKLSYSNIDNCWKRRFEPDLNKIKPTKELQKIKKAKQKKNHEGQEIVKAKIEAIKSSDDLYFDDSPDSSKRTHRLECSFINPFTQKKELFTSKVIARDENNEFYIYLYKNNIKTVNLYYEKGENKFYIKHQELRRGYKSFLIEN